MSYSQIDPIIHEWVKKHNLTLFTNYEGYSNSEYRAIYLSSEHECCQISIDEPESNMVSVHAYDIETNDDEELHKVWHVPITELGETLDNAITFLKQWFVR